uniref:Uncharacterized protein n=1 Tax=Arundo donax TaxID=35708 RepID=A0A0A9D3I2_ARUDO
MLHAASYVCIILPVPLFPSLYVFCVRAIVSFDLITPGIKPFLLHATCQQATSPNHSIP